MPLPHPCVEEGVTEGVSVLAGGTTDFDAGVDVSASSVAVPDDVMNYCRKLAAEHGLTSREAEILAFLALGRSAKYISEELVISYNTTRTHVRHVYEKLNIHSKQELLDCVLFGSGRM